MNYGIRLESKKTRAMLKIQSEIIQATRKFLTSDGFLEIRAPIIEPFYDPGCRGAKFFHLDFYGKPYTVTSALTVHKLILASRLGKIFSFCPCLRLEPKEARKTGRHLVEFCQIEVEIPVGDYEKAMQIAERLIQSIIGHIKQECKKELKILGRKLDIPKLPFKRLVYKEASELAKKLGFDMDGQEIPWEAEKAISEKFKAPFFVTQYPKGSRGFYDKDSKDIQLSFDLMYPEGFGEASSGSEREFEYKKIRKKLQKLGLEQKFQIYLKQVKAGIKPTSGFGIGLERLTRFICGLKDIADATPFPKIPGGESI